jgi:hypothetical protein
VTHPFNRTNLRSDGISGEYIMPQHIEIPSSPSTTNVYIIDNGSFITNMQGSDYMSPVLLGHEIFEGPSLAFMLHHESSGTKVLFDLGIRTDWRTAYPPEQLKSLELEGMGLRVDRDITEVLLEHGVSPSDIDAVIFRWVYFFYWISKCLSEDLQPPPFRSHR